MKQNITVLGDGGWGTTVACLLSSKGYDVTLWGAFPEHIKVLKTDRINRKFLPGVGIPDGVRFTADINDLKEDAIVVIAIPSKYLRKILGSFNGKLPGAKFVSLTKGIEIGSLKRPSEIIKEVLGEREICVLSGPSISFEVARGLPTTVVAASDSEKCAGRVQDIFTTATFRVYTSRDVIGVELGGALKNIIAMAAGISDGMNFGVNTKAALLTRGLVEIVRFGRAMGGNKETFFGLSGLGDLATTCMSEHSRNRRVGEEIAKGKKIKDILEKSELVAEGVTTTKSAYELAKKIKVEMPITEQIYKVLYGDKNPKDAVKELMTRTLKPEAI